MAVVLARLNRWRVCHVHQVAKWWEFSSTLISNTPDCAPCSQEPTGQELHRFQDQRQDAKALCAMLPQLPADESASLALQSMPMEFLRHSWVVGPV